MVVVRSDYCHGLYPFVVVDPVCDLDEGLICCLVGCLGSSVGCLAGHFVDLLEDLVIVQFLR